MKKLSDEEFNQILREKLLNYEEEAPSHAEQELFNTLGNNKILQRKKVVGVYVTVGSLLLMSVGSYYWMSSIERTALPTTKNKPDVRRLDHHPKTFQRTPFNGGQSLFAKTTNGTTNIEVDDDDKVAIDTTMAFVIRNSIELTKGEELASDFLTPPKSEKVPAICDTLISIAPENPRQRLQGKTWISFGVQPFLNYKRIRPIGGDGVQLSQFDGPPSLSSKRFGLRLFSSVDHRLSSNLLLGLGLSYFQFRETFQYTSSEQIQGIEPLNSVDELIQGASISVSSRYSLIKRSKRKQYISAMLDGQCLFTRSPSSTKYQVMLSFGYANEWMKNERIIRVTPMISYSLSQYMYPGVRVHPILLGVELVHSLPLNK